jgi:cytochrome c peroxidase
MTFGRFRTPPSLAIVLRMTRSLSLVLTLLATTSARAETKLRVPELGPVPPPPTFADDPVTPAKLALGAAIYFDARLSGSGHTACNSCHVHNTAFQDNLTLSTPDRSHPLDHPSVARNTTSFLNLIYAPIVRWDGSHTDLVDVLAFPFAEPNMNVARLPAGDTRVDVPAAQAALKRKLTVELPGYRRAFREAFAVDIATLTPPAIWRLTGRALRALMTQAVSHDSAFDRWNAGDDTAMSARAVRGLAVFRGKGRCIACHSGPLFTDFELHNISSAPPRPDGSRADEGRFLVTGKPEDRGAFLTPTLRSVYATSPYFHDGSKGGLRDVLAHFASPAVTADPNHDPLLSGALPLSDEDIGDLLELLKALRGTPVTSIAPPAVFP